MGKIPWSCYLLVKQSTTVNVKCAEWVGNALESKCVYPFPDANRPGKHCKPDETPIANRKVDDYNPKIKAVMLHKEGKLKATDEESVENFSTQFGSDKKIVKKFVLHLEVKQSEGFARADERCKLKQRQEKTFKDYH